MKVIGKLISNKFKNYSDAKLIPVAPKYKTNKSVSKYVKGKKKSFFYLKKFTRVWELIMARQNVVLLISFFRSWGLKFFFLSKYVSFFNSRRSLFRYYLLFLRFSSKSCNNFMERELQIRLFRYYMYRYKRLFHNKFRKVRSVYKLKLVNPRLKYGVRRYCTSSKSMDVQLDFSNLVFYKWNLAVFLGMSDCMDYFPFIRSFDNIWVFYFLQENNNLLFSNFFFKLRRSFEVKPEFPFKVNVMFVIFFYYFFLFLRKFDLLYYYNAFAFKLGFKKDRIFFIRRYVYSTLNWAKFSLPKVKHTDYDTAFRKSFFFNYFLMVQSKSSSWLTLTQKSFFSIGLSLLLRAELYQVSISFNDFTSTYVNFDFYDVYRYIFVCRKAKKNRALKNYESFISSFSVSKRVSFFSNIFFPVNFSLKNHLCNVFRVYYFKNSVFNFSFQVEFLFLYYLRKDFFHKSPVTFNSNYKEMILLMKVYFFVYWAKWIFMEAHYEWLSVGLKFVIDYNLWYFSRRTLVGSNTYSHIYKSALDLYYWQKSLVYSKFYSFFSSNIVSKMFDYIFMKDFKRKLKDLRLATPVNQEFSELYISNILRHFMADQRAFSIFYLRNFKFKFFSKRVWD